MSMCTKGNKTEIFIFVILSASVVLSVLPHKRFEYKLSFKGPHLVQRDGTVPFWEHGGHAIASDESIRITPSLRSKRGYVWTKNVVIHDHWEVEFTFKVSGRGRIGADGLAFWFTEQRGTEGPVFGSNDKWNGLAVLFDSFDNDGQHNNPYIMAMGNDGTLAYDHQTDGSSQQLGGCVRDFRNKPFPIKAKVEYYQKTLTVFINNGLSNSDQQYEMCLRAENVNLPATGYFGISGATGGLADDHDVISFLTHSLTPPVEGVQVEPQVSEAERLKYEHEFEEYHNKLQQAKEDYRKEHPDARPDDFDRDYFEDQDTRELKMIFEGQTFIHDTIRQLHHKLDEMIGRQEMTLSQVNNMNRQGGGVPPQGQQPPQGQLPSADSIKRYEVDQLLNNQRELSQNMKDVRSFVNDVQAKLTHLQQQGGGGTAGTYDATKYQNELKSILATVQNDIRVISTKQSQPLPQCPPAPDTGCVTTFYLFIMFIIQCAVFFVYAMYRSSKEAQAKKFY